uniref:Phage portal protein n=1 Tax=Strongyloides papillosus TaxID=174720 RepID=A0A0N5CDY6_STREA
MYDWPKIIEEGAESSESLMRTYFKTSANIRTPSISAYYEFRDFVDKNLKRIYERKPVESLTAMAGILDALTAKKWSVTNYDIGDFVYLNDDVRTNFSNRLITDFVESYNPDQEPSNFIYATTLRNITGYDYKDFPSEAKEMLKLPEETSLKGYLTGKHPIPNYVYLNTTVFSDYKKYLFVPSKVCSDYLIFENNESKNADSTKSMKNLSVLYNYKKNISSFGVFCSLFWCNEEKLPGFVKSIIECGFTQSAWCRASGYGQRMVRYLRRDDLLHGEDQPLNVLDVHEYSSISHLLTENSNKWRQIIEHHILSLMSEVNAPVIKKRISTNSDHIRMIMGALLTFDDDPSEFTSVCNDIESKYNTGDIEMEDTESNRRSVIPLNVINRLQKDLAQDKPRKRRMGHWSPSRRVQPDDAMDIDDNLVGGSNMLMSEENVAPNTRIDENNAPGTNSDDNATSGTGTEKNAPAETEADNNVNESINDSQNANLRSRNSDDDKSDDESSDDNSERSNDDRDNDDRTTTAVVSGSETSNMILRQQQGDISLYVSNNLNADETIRIITSNQSARLENVVEGSDGRYAFILRIPPTPAPVNNESSNTEERRPIKRRIRYHAIPFDSNYNYDEFTFPDGLIMLDCKKWMDHPLLKRLNTCRRSKFWSFTHPQLNAQLGDKTPLEVSKFTQTDVKIYVAMKYLILKSGTMDGLLHQMQKLNEKFNEGDMREKGAYTRFLNDFCRILNIKLGCPYWEDKKARDSFDAILRVFAASENLATLDCTGKSLMANYNKRRLRYNENAENLKDYREEE